MNRSISTSQPLDIIEISKELASVLPSMLSTPRNNVPEVVSIESVTSILTEFMSHRHPELLGLGCPGDVFISETIAALAVISAAHSSSVTPASLDESALLGFKIQCDVKIALIPSVFAAVIAAVAGESVFGPGSLVESVFEAEVMAALSYLPVMINIRREHKITEEESYLLRLLAMGTRTTRELATRSGMPPRTVRRILSGLESRQLVRVSGTLAGAKEYRAVGS